MRDRDTIQEVNTIRWLVVCVNEFAHQFSIDIKTAFKYLYEYGGINFLTENYEVEHTLSFTLFKIEKN